MIGRRRVTYGLLDQAVIAAAGAGNGLLATAVLPPAQAGGVLVSIATIYVAIGISRALIGDVVLTHTARFAGVTRRRMHADAVATAGAVGLAVAAGFVLTAIAWRSPITAPLLFAAPFLPAILAHDTARYTYQSQSRQDQALIIDAVWVTVQITVVTALLLTGNASGGALLAAWGVGAAAGAGAYFLRGGPAPWRGNPLRWLRETRRLSGWFTGTALIGQTQAQLIALVIPAVLGPAAYAGLRLAQLVILQPVQNLVLASMGMLVPRASTMAAERDVAGLRRQIRYTLVVAAVAAAAGITIVEFAAAPVLAWYAGGAYTSIAPLAWPVALQAGIYLAQIPFTATLRGMQHGARLFAQYAVFTITSLTGAAAGAHWAGLPGTAWGLTIGAAVGLAAMVLITLDALRKLTPVVPPPHPRRSPAAASAPLPE